MKLLTVPLSKTRLAPQDHRLRPIDKGRVTVIASSLRGGSEQLSPFLAYEHRGIYYVFGGGHAWSAFDEATEDKSISVSLLLFDSTVEKDILLWAARADNHVPLNASEWRETLWSLLPHFPTQRAMAEAIGVSQGFVSEYLNGDPEARAAARRERVRPPNSEPQKSSSYRYEQDTRNDIPEISAETGETPDAVAPHPSSPALVDSNGALVAGPARGHLLSTKPVQGPAPSPAFLSLSSLRENVGAVRKTLSRRTYLGLRPEDRGAFLADLEALAYRTLDFVASTQTGEWNGDAPVALRGKVQAMRAKVRIDGKTFVLPLIEKLSSGWRVAGRDGILFIRKQDCLVIEPVRTGKVSA